MSSDVCGTFVNSCVRLYMYIYIHSNFTLVPLRFDMVLFCFVEQHVSYLYKFCANSPYGLLLLVVVVLVLGGRSACKLKRIFFSVYNRTRKKTQRERKRTHIITPFLVQRTHSPSTMNKNKNNDNKEFKGVSPISFSVNNNNNKGEREREKEWKTKYSS